MGSYVHLILLLTVGFALGKSSSLPDFPDTFNRQRTIEFFQHIVRVNGSQAVTEVPVGGNGGPSPGAFGYAVVFDHKLTQGSDYFSAEVGRVRGAGVVASRDGSQAHETFTVSFSERNGAVSCVGAFELHQSVSRIPCVGGSGEFYRTYGIFTSQVVQTNGGNAIAHVQLDLRSE